MATESRAYSRDEMWRVVLTAWKASVPPVYNAIGATIKAQHWEEHTVWLFFKRQGWVDKPVESISVQATFEGMLPNSLPGRGAMSDVRRDSFEADVRLWSAGISIGLPMPAEGPGPNPAQLDVRSVRAHGGATVEGQNLECEEVSANR
jgi:hypothetical protein